MKKYFTFLLVLACVIANGQGINEVLQYNANNIQGTARYQGLSGAFGALGGDLSALNINPAGSAVFNHNLATISGSNYNRDNLSLYFNSNANSKRNSFEINQAGAVAVLSDVSGDSNWKKIALAFNYDIVENFDDDIFIAGNSTQGIDNYFLNFAQGTPFGPLLIQDGEFIEEAYLDIGENLGFRDQQAFLGYYGGLIDPVDVNDDNNTSYVSNADYNSVNQEFYQSSNGYNNRYTLNIASQYQDNLYVGASVNIHSVIYDKYTEFTEEGYDANSAIQFTTFDNYLHTEGTGLSFNLGAIAKLNENIRIGGSYQSPTWYYLTDDTSQKINSDLADDDIGFIDFNIINLYEKYTIKTPSKLTGSMAIIFGKDGLISFDYDFQDMSQAKLKPTNDPSFDAENDIIANELGTTSSYRVGGEYRIKQVSLRGGYRFVQSPYADGSTIGDLTGYSAGIGYNFGTGKIDLAYQTSEQDVNKQLFSSGFATPATINNINTNVTLSLTLNL